MRAIKIEHTGNTEQFKDILKYHGKNADKATIEQLDSDIEFNVVDLRNSHGNLNKSSKSAWLCPTNNDGSFNITISW